ncbi:ribonuclease H-like domain-containing protein [Mycena crocata]|nr:ribonuclease H-like domain-containing protein [Mycena crocata]
MSKTPLSLVSRCRPAPSSPPRRVAMSTAQPPKESRVLAALAGMSVAELGEARNAVIEANKPPPPHPFFRAATTPSVQPRTAPPMKQSISLPPPTKKSSLVRVSPPKAVEAPAAAAVEEPTELPLYSYKSYSPAPKMRFTRSEAEANEWVGELDQTGPISMDLEWVVEYRRGFPMRPVSIVQVADKKNILVIQLRTSRIDTTMARFPVNLQRVLEDPDIPKMGANILNDAKKLFKDYGVMMANVVELGHLAKQADPASTDTKIFGNNRKIVSLANLVSRYLNKTLGKEKDVRTSNWEDPELEKKPVMLEYAANDAYCALQVYNHLMASAKTNDIKLDASKYTGQVYFESLSSPPPTSTSTDPKTLPGVPVIYYNDDMAHAGMSMQHLRAYRHWLAKWDIDSMCKELSTRDDLVLKRATIITYVVSALKCWPKFPRDLGALRLFVQTDLKSWQYNYEWLSKVGNWELEKKK